MHVHVINNTDDRGIHGRSLAAKRLASGTTFHHNQDLFVDARTDGVDGEKTRPAVGADPIPTVTV